MMKKCIITLILTAIMTISAAIPAVADADNDRNGIIETVPVNEEHARGIADAARAYSEGYSFEGNFILLDELSDLMLCVYNDNPDLFCLNRSYIYYTRNTDRGTVVTSVLFEYNMSEAEYRAAMDEVNDWKDAVLSLTDPSFTDTQYLVFFHDYIAANYDYDTSYTSRTLYSLIKTGKGVCQAYLYAYALLLDAVGIENSWASSAEMNHVWNLVKLYGEWYHVDVTWDDPIGIATGIPLHRYFLLSDSAISSDEGEHRRWVAPYECTDATYDRCVLTAVQSVFAPVNGKWYYIKDGDLYATDYVVQTGEMVKDFDYTWYVWGDPGRYYIDSYSAILAYDDKLFITTPDSIISYDPATGETSEVYKYNGGEGYIYGFMINMGADGVSGADLEDGRVKVNIGTVAGDRNKMISVKLPGSSKPVLPVIPEGKGDADGDGKVNLADASLVLQSIAKWNVTIDESAADLDGDGKVSLSDVTLTLMLIAGWFN